MKLPNEAVEKLLLDVGRQELNLLRLKLYAYLSEKAIL
jgi:hypothetical protein